MMFNYTIKTHQMRVMRATAINDPDVFHSVSQSVTWMGCAETAEQTDILFAVKISEDPGSIFFRFRLRHAIISPIAKRYLVCFGPENASGMVYYRMSR